MSVYVTVEQLREAAYGVSIPSGEDVDAALQRLIDKAEDRLPDSVAARVESGALSRERVAGVVEDMVMRVASNPRGLRSVSIDDYTETIDTAGLAGGLYLADRERDLLLGDNRRGSVGMMKLASPSWWLR